MSDLNLTPLQLSTLRLVAEHSGDAIAQLTDHTDIGASTMRGRLARLVALGVVESFDGYSDWSGGGRAVKCYQPTDDGKAHLEAEAEAEPTPQDTPPSCATCRGAVETERRYLSTVCTACAERQRQGAAGFNPERASYLRGILPSDPGYREARAEAMRRFPDTPQTAGERDQDTARTSDDQGAEVVRSAMAAATLAAAQGDGTIGGELSPAERRAIFWRVLEREMCKAKAAELTEAGS